MASITILNLQYHHLHCTAIEIHPMFHIGYLGAGSRIAYRINLKNDFEREIRIGTYIGLDMPHVDIDFKTSFALRPFFQVLYNKSFGSIGFGLDIPINILLDKNGIEGGDGHDDKYLGVGGGFMVYLTLRLGRVKWFSSN